MTNPTSPPVELPLFPLHTVLFPGGRLPLQIFEPRYLAMVSRCMRDGRPFGIVLIRHGNDARLTRDADQPDIFDVGTEAEIVDFNPLANGRLGIVVRGARKFRVARSWASADHLLMGSVNPLPDEPAGPVPAEHAGLVDVLRDLSKHPLVQRLGLEIDTEDVRSVGWRLAELLPIEPEIKHSLLKLQWPRERMQELARLVDKLRG
ncbi:MAG: LON peptidase substrate-binding domain-containing protein [Gammaproteobacteria bacterium]